MSCVPVSRIFFHLYDQESIVDTLRKSIEYLRAYIKLNT